MGSHQITIEQVQKALSEMEHTIISSACTNAGGKVVTKRIIVRANGGLCVMVNKEIVWEGIQPYLAMEAYNEH